MSSQAQRPHPPNITMDSRVLPGPRSANGPPSAGLTNPRGLPSLHPHPPPSHPMPSYHSPTHSAPPPNKNPAMYHRSVPHSNHHPGDRTSRLFELMDGLKTEVESLADNVSVYKTQRDEYELKLGQQVNELASFQQNLYELERAHQLMKQQLEEEIERLHRELDGFRQGRNGVATRGFPDGPAPTVGSGKSFFAPMLPQDCADHPSKRLKMEENVEGRYPTEKPEQPITGECVLRSEPIAAPFKREGKDWFAIFNPHSPSLSGSPLKIDLLSSLDHSSVVCCIKFSQCGGYLATGCNHLTSVYNVDNGEKIAQVNLQVDSCCRVLGSIPAPEQGKPPADLYIRSVVFSPDRSLLATGAEDRIVRVWNVDQQQLVWSLAGHTLEIYSLDWSRDGKIIVSGSGDKCIKVWDAETGRCLTTMSMDDKRDETAPKDAGVTGVAINSVYPYCIAAGSLDRIVRVWDHRTGKLLERFEGHLDSVYSVAFSPDGRSIVSGALDQTLKVWDLSQKTLAYLSQSQESQEAVPFDQPLITRTCRHTFVGHKDFVLSVAFAGTNGSFGRVDEAGNPVATPAGDALAEVEWVVSGSKDWSVIFWDAKSYKSGQMYKLAAPQFLLQGHENSGNVALSPNRGLFATGGGDCKARIWRVSASVASSGTMPPAGPLAKAQEEGPLVLPKIQDHPASLAAPPEPAES